MGEVGGDALDWVVVYAWVGMENMYCIMGMGMGNGWMEWSLFVRVGLTGFCENNTPGLLFMLVVTLSIPYNPT
jgi:hypothetical protein